MDRDCAPADARPLGEVLEDDDAIRQKAWQYVRRLNSATDELLDATALVGGTRTYTYRQMFRMWDRYAEVFSALGMTGENQARVSLFGSSAVEPIIALYALNMCGASVSVTTLMDFFDEKGLERMVAEEGITDIVMPDFLMPRDLYRHLMARRAQMGIRNVVILRTTLAGPFTPPVVSAYVRAQREALRGMPGAQIMDELLVRYAGHTISYGTEPDEAAFVMHTSGTTKGVHKPVPLSDAGVNEGARRVLRREDWHFLHRNMRTMLGMELASTYALVDIVHTPLVAGGTLFTLFLDCLNPNFPEAVKRYDLNVLISTPFVLDALEACEADFSSVELTFVGGAYVSPAAKRHYDATMRRLGSPSGITIGYGLSEAGGACVVASPERTDDAMGYPLPGIQVKIFDEDEGVYYDIGDGPRTGVLFVSSPSVSSGRIGDATYFTLEEIDGEPYLNTFDLVRVNDDGSLTHAGRMNRFFVNNEGIRFDAGLVESAISAQPKIRACAIAPQYDKTIHDTVPVLYVQVAGPHAHATGVVRDALVKVFVTDGAFEKSNLPAQCVLVDAIPRNAQGKVDVHAVQAGGTGATFQVSPVRRAERLVDVSLIPASDAICLQAGMPDELDQMELLYAQMVLWFIPGAHSWYTTGNAKQKRRVLEKGVTNMKQFVQQAASPEMPQGMPFPMMQPPFGQAQQAMPVFPCVPVMPFVPAMSMPQGGAAQQPFQMPQFPSMPFGSQAGAQQAMPVFPFAMPAAQGQQASAPVIPVCPFPTQQGAQAQQAMPAFPFAMPFPAQPAPNAQDPAQQGVQTPYGSVPQPYELYEGALKNAIEFLKHLLAQSEAARAAAEPKDGSQDDAAGQADGDESREQAADGDAKPADAMGFMPGFGCQQIPMPFQPGQQAPGIGVMPANNYLGNLVASFFGAAQTDYFYED